MMPSRGLSRLLLNQSRSLSRIPPAHPRTLSYRTYTVARTAKPWTRSIPTAIPSIAAVRYASSAPSPAQPANTPASPPAAGETASFPNLDTITLDDIDVKDAVDISSIPEGIGYLKEIGIDYGFGPTSVIEWILEHMHIYTGLPWWASIAATALALRAVMFPLYLRQSDMMARQNALVSITKPIQDRMMEAQREGDQHKMMAAWQEQSIIRKRAGISYRDQFIPIGVQSVIGFCGYKLLSACSSLPVPGFRDGGFLWLQDLTLTDGYLLMPVIMAGTIHLVMRLGGESGAAATQSLPAGTKNIMLWGVPGLIGVVTAFQPGGVCVWFAATGAFGIIQGQALKRPSVRRFFGLAPLYTPKPGEAAANPLMAMFEKKSTSKPINQKPPSVPKPGYMKPTYQSPNIKRRPSARTIDTTLVDHQPPTTPK